MQLIQRPTYLEKIIKYRDTTGIIKIITGIRRGGKSTLFKLYQDYLLNNNVLKEQIININFESMENEDLLDYRNLYEYIKSKLLPNKMNYIFLDEIQNVSKFQRVLTSFYSMKNVDLYITGSNAYLLSGELATLLSGRYIQIQVYPLSFKEYLSTFDDKSNLEEKFNRYIKYGSFPYILTYENEEEILSYLESIYNAIILKDVLQRSKISDVNRLEKLILFMFNNIGSLTSINNIKNQMINDNFKIDVATIENYLNTLTNSFILHKAPRYDIRGKELLKTNDKYYIADTGLRYFLLRSDKKDIGHILENVVHLELLRRGYKVYVGKNGTLEIDFVATKGNKIEYYQIAHSVLSVETLERELNGFKNIKDNYPKYLLTADYLMQGNYDGVECINIINWLLEE